MRPLILALLAGCCLAAGSMVTAAQANDCGFFCQVAHPIKSHLDTGYRCHTWRCRYHRYQKGNDTHGGPDAHADVGLSTLPFRNDTHTYRCIKAWHYRMRPYWHWRYYTKRSNGHVFLRVGRDHVGYTLKRPRCWS